MKLKELQEVKQVLSKFIYDEQNNIRPEVNKALGFIEIDIIRRKRESRAMRDNFYTPEYPV